MKVDIFKFNKIKFKVKKYQNIEERNIWEENYMLYAQHGASGTRSGSH